MKLTFRKKGKTIEALDDAGNIIGKFKNIDGDWEFTASESASIPDDLKAQFVDYMTPSVETPVVSAAPLPRPPQGPVSGTLDLAYMTWAADFMSDDEFRLTYASRKEKLTFLPWLEKQNLPAFHARFVAL